MIHGHMVKRGYKYRHFKGTVYEVLDLVEHTETGEVLVAYHEVDDDHVWVRPYSMFRDTVIVNGEEVPRFECLTEEVEIYVGKPVKINIEDDLLQVFFQREDEDEPDSVYPAGAVMATGAPDWLLEMNESEQSQWRAVEGGLYWPAVDQVIRLPRPMIDPEKLSEFMEGVREDGEGVLSMVIDEGGEED